MAATRLFEDQIYRTLCPAIFELHQLIPSSTACVEILFSLLNLLCTPHRNRLGEATLESLIRLCRHTESLGEEEGTRIIDKFAEKPRNVVLLT
ncbi:hypothetical protein DPMN_029075 [Dreissena polymorpha]|uniref:HAT C-terminal dimerisation domain-containing protein n=1 Tax=Dreissena polymorpha TaxID=45954 RepID=A0A9D4RF52_DREPO|nr:hypothetical protein DPMN_029075 [Dreissena polymorpha]